MKDKKNYEIALTLVPQILRLGYKMFKAWKSDGISKEEAVELIEDAFTIFIYTFEELGLSHNEEPTPESPEDEPEEVYEEDEGDDIEEEVKPVKRALGRLRK